MVTPALKQHFQSQGISLIPKDAGARLFAEEVSGVNPDEVEIVIGGVASSTPSFISNLKRTLKLDKRLDLQKYSWLNDHQIQGKRVVPIVMVHEWFHQFAQSVYPDMSVSHIENVRVLKGIRIEESSTDPITLTMTGKESIDPEQDCILIDIELSDKACILHYSARVVVGQMTLPMKEITAEEPADSIEWIVDSSKIYGDRLFHGPSFQVIDQLESFHREGAVGLLKGELAKVSVVSSLDAFPILLDGGLQLARLWGYEIYDQSSLPMCLGTSLIVTREISDGESIRCQISILQQNANKFVMDISWIDSHDRCFAQLQQVEMYFVKERRPA